MDENSSDMTPDDEVLYYVQAIVDGLARSSGLQNVPVTRRDHRARMLTQFRSAVMEYLHHNGAASDLRAELDELLSDLAPQSEDPTN